MSHPSGQPAPASPSAPAFREFVAIIALMMGLMAFSIDNLLPAFPAIHADFPTTSPNDVQMMVYAYLIGIGSAQLLFGTLSDVMGRKPVLMAGLIIYVAGSLLAAFTESFSMLLFARLVQGIGGAAGRVLAVAIVRDRFEGHEMARVMSLAMMVFLTVPIVAPALGSVILLAGSWRYIFAAMLGLALILSVWFGARMPETLRPELRMPFSLAAIGAGMLTTLRTRRAVGYSTAMGLLLSALMTYIGTASQIFETDVYQIGHWFPALFAAVAGLMAVASFLSASLVRKVGMRRLSHFGIVGFTVVAGVMVLAAALFGGRPPLLLFCLLIALAQFLFALTMPNFNALAMEPLGAVAGTASSFIGAYTTLMSALFAFLAGRLFDGTVMPVSATYLVFGALSILCARWAEGGRPSAA